MCALLRCYKKVLEFLPVFHERGTANIVRLLSYWRTRKSMIDNYRRKRNVNNDLHMLCLTSTGIRRRIPKTVAVRGRQRAPWVIALHEILLDKFKGFEVSALSSTQTFSFSARAIVFRHLPVFLFFLQLVTRDLGSWSLTILRQCESKVSCSRKGFCLTYRPVSSFQAHRSKS